MGSRPEGERLVEALGKVGLDRRRFRPDHNHGGWIRTQGPIERFEGDCSAFLFGGARKLPARSIEEGAGREARIENDSITRDIFGGKRCHSAPLSDCRNFLANRSRSNEIQSAEARHKAACETCNRPKDNKDEQQISAGRLCAMERECKARK